MYRFIYLSIDLSMHMHRNPECLCESARCILARLLELCARSKFTAAAGASAPRRAKAGDRRAAN